MNCPRCLAAPEDATPYREAPSRHRAETQLVPEHHPSGLAIDRCPGCGGLWLAPGVMERAEQIAREKGHGLDAGGIADLYRRTYANARHASEHVILDCPACGEVMFEREWTYGSQVRADVCMSCRGVWLDEGELDDLARFFGASWT